MFSQTVEYALRAIVYLAGQKGTRTTQQIAAATRVPAAYLAKVLQNLSRVEVVRSQRGLHGGFSLGKSPDELTMWEVVQAVEPTRRLQSCPLGLDIHRGSLCALHKKMDDALAEIENAFRSSSIAGLLAEAEANASPCSFPYVDAPKENGRIALK